MFTIFTDKWFKSEKNYSGVITLNRENHSLNEASTFVLVTSYLLKELEIWVTFVDITIFTLHVANFLVYMDYGTEAKKQGFPSIESVITTNIDICDERDLSESNYISVPTF